MRRPLNYRPSHQGFSLVELLGVLLLLGLFLGVGIMAFQATQNASMRRQTQATLQSNAALLQTYKAQSGTFPDALLDDMPTIDTWGQAIIYQRTPSGFSLRSLAEDGLLNTSDDLTYVEE